MRTVWVDRIESVKIDLPEEYVPLVIEALEHYYALTRAKQHEDVRYQQAADWFKRKRPATEEAVPPAKRNWEPSAILVRGATRP